MWSKLTSSDMAQICQYLPQHSHKTLRLICKSWTQLLNPILFKFASLKMLTNSLQPELIVKFGPLITHLIPSSNYYFTRYNLLMLSQSLTNLEYVNLSSLEVLNFQLYNTILDYWPNLTCLKTNNNRNLGELKLIGSKLSTLYLINNSNLNCLLSISNSDNFELKGNLNNLKLNPIELDLLELVNCFEIYTNILKLDLELIKLQSFNIEQVHSIFQSIAKLNYLRELKLKLSLDFNTIPPHTSLFPVEFNITNLISFSFQIYHRTNSGDGGVEVNIASNQDLLQPYEIFNIELESLKNLFYSTCDKLKYLSIHTINSDLLDLILDNCTQLTTLILDNPLPCSSLSSSSSQKLTKKFELLKELQCTGFTLESIENSCKIKQIFQKVNNLTILRSTRYTPQLTHINWNLIPFLFPQLLLLTLNNISIEEFPSIKIQTNQITWSALSTSLLPTDILPIIQLIQPLLVNLKYLKFFGIELNYLEVDELIIERFWNFNKNLKFILVKRVFEGEGIEEEINI